jgi:sugar phosphate permease
MAGAALGMALVLFSASPWAVPSLFLMLIIGGMTTTFMTVNTALIQNHVSDAMRGRVMSLREIAMGLGPAWSLLFGLIGEQTSVPFALGLLGALCIAVSISLLFFLSGVRASRM